VTFRKSVKAVALCLDLSVEIRGQHGVAFDLQPPVDGVDESGKLALALGVHLNPITFRSPTMV
jgi:hypothetical protein